jgi:uncharacterized membrane protein
LVSIAQKEALLFFVALSAILSLLGLANFQLVKVSTTDIWFVFISFILAHVLSDSTLGYFLQESERRVSIRFVSETHNRRISLLYSWYFFAIVFGSCLASILIFGLQYLSSAMLSRVALTFIVSLSIASSALVSWNFEHKLGKKARAWRH